MEETGEDDATAYCFYVWSVVSSSSCIYPMLSDLIEHFRAVYVQIVLI